MSHFLVMFHHTTPNYGLHFRIVLLFFLSPGAGDSLVQCRTTLDCSGNMTLMSARDCCVSNPDGLSFTVPGVETCQVCIGM